jgi:hypothetical protein
MFLKARGLSIAPEVAVGDGALGFWKALDETFPSTRHQHCWLHKTLNVLDKLPKSMQPNAHKDLREIWLAPLRQVSPDARGMSRNRCLARSIMDAGFAAFRSMPEGGKPRRTPPRLIRPIHASRSGEKSDGAADN